MPAWAGGGAEPSGQAGSLSFLWLERKVKELRRANEILRKASAYFAMAEFDHHGR